MRICLIQLYFFLTYQKINQIILIHFYFLVIFLILFHNFEKKKIL